MNWVIGSVCNCVCVGANDDAAADNDCLYVNRSCVVTSMRKLHTADE